MSQARQQIFSKLRQGVKRNPEQQAAAEARVQQRLQSHPRSLIPARGQGDATQRRQVFIQMATEAAAEVHPISQLTEIPALLAAAGIKQLVITNESWIASLPWQEQGISLQQRVAAVGDSASLTGSFAAIAETGTLMLHSSPDSPTTLNFLPDWHWVLLRSSRIQSCYEDAWQLLRTELGSLPRTVNMITGPSRSADIEQRLQMGAHGPRKLSILLWDDQN
ncbi:LutC/YkgG family protein [Balneatrix alpica]|uniref:LutC/YkgG family protein n=1 Tax=Balneatrix alpica TaxID=75684 RepID=UPI0027390F3C|nr:LUD domain-containing protein [Balneatrix alpica]